MTDAERAAIVRANLESRIGALMAENIELMIRIHELEQPDDKQEP